MKTRSTLASLVLAMATIVGIAAVTAPMTGCSMFRGDSTPEERYFDSQELFIGITSVALQAKRDGLIEQEDWDNTWNPAIQEGNRILDDMEAAQAAGDVGRLGELRAILSSILTRMNAARASNGSF